MTVPPPTPPVGPEQRPAQGTAGAGPGPADDPAQVLAALGSSWLWALGSALATLVPGILILVWPGETLHVLAVIIGLYLLLTGAFRFVAAFARESHGERLTRVLLAVLFVLAGVLCLRHPLQTIAALSLIVGVTWLVSGMLTLYTAIAATGLPHRGVLFGAGALGVAAGIVVLALPTQSAVALTRLLGLWLVLLGLVELAVALALRAALRRAGKDSRPAS
ncbi:HdeD family acid-resistance protein [Streptomyces sp. NPDC001315]|uniref:HdeD family acid-resistance protein n=1 Tax=Streptomyces sp. NPDC001315 TaxID=3364562 RepID=UPI00368751AD